MSKHSLMAIILLVVVSVVLLGLPLAAGAQSPNGITSVKVGAVVSGRVEIAGNASDSSFWKWQLDLLSGGKTDAAVFLATDTKPGSFSYTLDTTSYPDGDHALRLRIVRMDGNYAEYSTLFTIANLVAKGVVVTPLPTASVVAPVTVTATAPISTSVAGSTSSAITRSVTPTPAPLVNGITSVKSGATLMGAVDVEGNASDPSFAKWQLDLLPGSDPNEAVFLALGVQPGQLRHILDTTRFPNGAHALRLRVVRADGNYSEYVTPCTIANPVPTPQLMSTPMRAPTLGGLQSTGNVGGW